MGNPFAAVSSWSAAHPAWAIALALVAVAGAGAGMSQAESGRISELFVPDDLPALEVQRQIEDIWGESEAAFLLYLTDDPTNPNLLREVARDMENAAEIDGVQEVVGLTTLLEARLGSLDVPDAQLRGAAEQLAENPSARGFIVDDALLVRVVMDPVSDIPAMTDELDAVRDGSDASAEVYAAGSLYIEEYQSENAGGDVQFLMPLSLLVVLLLLGFLFRRVQDVAVPIFVVLLAIVMAYGTVAWAGFALAPPSFIVMPLLLGLGVDYMLHIVYAYREQSPKATVAERFRAAGRNVGYPVFYTATTTLIGFGSFLVSNIPQIRTWGLLIGSGALYAFLLGFTLMPALYRLRRRKHRATRLPFDNALNGITRVVMGHRGKVLIAGLLVTGGLAIAATQVEIVDTVEFDAGDDVPAVKDLNEVQERFGGQSVVTFLIEADDRDDLVAFENALAQEPLSGFLDGPIQRLRQSGDPDGPLVGPATDGVATDNYWLVTVGYTQADRDDALEAFHEVADDSPLDARLTGRDVLEEESRERFLPSLANSTLIALGLVVILLGVVFRRPLIALLAFSPLVITVLWQLGVQTIVGIPINPITGVMTAMILGVGVDYSLHIMAHFQRSRSNGATSRAAAASAMHSVGRPVLAASITTVFAFAVLGFSSLLPLQQFGIVAAIVVTCAFIVSLTILPVLASYLPDPQRVRFSEPREMRVQFREVPAVKPRFVDPEVEVWFHETAAPVSED